MTFETRNKLKLRMNAKDGVNQTNYPHLDQRHLKYYDLNAFYGEELPDLSIYEMLVKTAKKHMNVVAIDFYGRKITYAEMIKKIDEYADAFKNMGVKKGEIVTIISPNTPEVFYSIYALNKIGAVSSIIDPRNSNDRIKFHLNETKSKRAIMLDVLYPKIDRLIGDTNLKEVYTISISDSLPFGLNFLQKSKTLIENCRKRLPNCPKNDKYKSLVKEVSKHKGKSKFKPRMITGTYSKKDDLAIIINTSGTTAAPKGVMLSNDNINAVAYNYIKSGMNYDVGDRFLGIMPCFVAYGVGVGTHMPFALGLTNVVIPALKAEEFPKIVVKNKPNHFAGVPTHYQYLLESPVVRNKNLNYIKTAAAGGDVFDKKCKRGTNEFLHNHGCDNKVKVGYGSSENAGVAASQFYIGESTSENELSTVGIPVYYTNIEIVDPETGESLAYNEEGEIVLSGRGVMLGYFNNEELTNEVIEYRNGVRSLHTGDLGVIASDGTMQFLGRIKRLIVGPDGHKIFPKMIEEVVINHKYVKSCACVGVKDSHHVNGAVPVVFIEMVPGHESEVDKMIEELKTMSLQCLPERDVAQDYQIIEKIPLTKNEKVDYDFLIDKYNNEYREGMKLSRII